MLERVAVVTGASSGIGAATARRLADEGFHVVIGARRRDRLDALAGQIGATALPLDVTDPVSVEEFAAATPRCDVLVNNAGGALGLEPIEQADIEDWRWMYETNVLGAAAMTRALLPKLIASNNGHVVFMGSTAAHTVYEGGAGYTGAKHAVWAMAQTLRLELYDKPVRVTEIDPGMVMTEEFSLVRFRGDAERAKAVYTGVPSPLTADDIADCVAFAVTRPPHVNIDCLVVKPRAQASAHKVYRVD